MSKSNKTDTRRTGGVRTPKPMSRRACELELARLERSPNLPAAQKKLGSVFGKLHADALALLVQEKAVPRDRFGPLLGYSEREIQPGLTLLVRAAAVCSRSYLWNPVEKRPEPAWLFLDEFGRTLIGFQPNHPYIPVESNRVHNRFVLESREQCMIEFPEKRWVSEQELIERFGRGSDDPRSRTHTADGALEDDDGTLTAVEAERSGKPEFYLAGNMQKLLEPPFSGGYYFCPGYRQEQLEAFKNERGFDGITVISALKEPGIG